MKPSTRVAGRYVVEAELGGDDELRRFRARDGDTLVEVVTPSLTALFRPGVRDAFTRLQLPAHPAALPTLATDSVDDVPARVRPPTLATLAAYTAETGPRLTPAQAVSAAGWLAPAILAAGGAGLGELGPEDLALDADGVLRLAPTGVPRPESVARAPHTRAPEGTSTPEADLYGLGATLYRAVTGAWPAEARPASDYGVAPAADALLAALMDTDPAARRAAVADLPCEPVHLALPEPARRTTSTPVRTSTPATTSVRTTVPSPAVAPLPLGRELAPYAVLVPLSGLSEEALRVVAARSAAAPEAVRRAAARGATWCVDTAPTEAEANRIKARLAGGGVPGARIALTTVPKVIQLLLIALFAGGVGTLTGFAIVGLGIAAIFFWLAMTNLRAMFATVETRSAVAERERAALPADALEARVRALRRRVADAALPTVILAGLRADVVPLEDRLDELRGLEAELAGATAADLKARRDRVAADLAALATSVDAVDSNLTRALTEHADLRAARALPAPPAAPAGEPEPTAAPAPADAGTATAQAADAEDGPRRPPPGRLTQ